MSGMKKSDLLKLLGKRIKKLRLDRGMSQVNLVAKIQGYIYY